MIAQWSSSKRRRIHGRGRTLPQHARRQLPRTNPPQAASDDGAAESQGFKGLEKGSIEESVAHVKVMMKGVVSFLHRILKKDGNCFFYARLKKIHATATDILKEMERAIRWERHRMLGLAFEEDPNLPMMIVAEMLCYRIENELAAAKAENLKLWQSKMGLERDVKKLKVRMIDAEAKWVVNDRIREEGRKDFERQMASLKEEMCTTTEQMREKIELEHYKTTCFICFDLPRDTLIFPCLHFLSCQFCLRKTQRRKNECPACRGPIAGTVQVHL